MSILIIHERKTFPYWELTDAFNIQSIEESLIRVSTLDFSL